MEDFYLEVTRIILRSFWLYFTLLLYVYNYFPGVAKIWRLETEPRSIFIEY